MKKYFQEIALTYKKAHVLSHTFLTVGLSIASMLLISGMLLYIKSASDLLFVESIVKPVFNTAYAVSLVAFLFFYLSDYIIKKES